jgi:hypothetical protein
MVFPNRLKTPEQQAKQLEADINKGLDDTSEALRWCKRHLHDRRSADAMRLVQLNLAYLALAIDWQMEGDLNKALAAIDRVWWAPHKDGDDASDQSVTGH